MPSWKRLSFCALALLLAVNLLWALYPRESDSQNAGSQCVSTAVAGGTPDALTVPLLPCVFTTNLLVLFPSANNVTQNPTLQMIGAPGGPQPIVTGQGQGVGPGSLLAGAPVILIPTGSRWILVTQPGGQGGLTSGITALSGDVAATGPGSVSAVINPNAVTYGKFQQVNADTLVGNSGAGFANVGAVPIGNGLTFASGSLVTASPDNTSSSNYTLAALDMAGERNMNGTGLTLFLPAISANVFAGGMGTLFTDYSPTSALTVSSTPAINGLPLPGTLHSFGFYNCTSNATSLDCFGFPGYGTITTNSMQKFLDASGAATASALVDNGTIVRSSEPVSAQQNQSFANEYTNDTGTGTSANKLAKLTTSGNAIVTATTDTDGSIGVVIGNAGLSGIAQIAFAGTASCVFDNATTAGDYVTISSGTGGDCHDSGSSRPAGSQTIGRVLSTNGGAGTYQVSLALGTTNTAGGGSGTVNAGTSGQLAYYASSAAAVSGNVNLTVSGGALSVGVPGSAAGSIILGGATSGTATINVPVVAGATTFQLPGANGTSGNLLVNQGSNATAWKPTSGDATISAAGAITVTSSNGTAFGTAAFANTGTSGHTVPFLDGGDTFTGNNYYNGPTRVGSKNVSGTYSIADTTDPQRINVDTSSAAVTVNLPASPSVDRCYLFKDFKRTATATNTLTLAAGGATTVEGAASKVFSTAGFSVQACFTSSTNNWDLS